MFIPKIMIVDHSGICHGVKFAMAKHRLKSGEKSTFVIFGYLQTLQWLYRTIKPTISVIACDSRESKRKEIFAGYKAREEKTPEMIALDKLALPQFDELKNYVLPMIGFSNIFEAKGFEADDIIASVCKKNKNNNIVVVTRDKDIYQLLTPHVSIYEPYLRKYFTLEDYKEQYGITPKQWKKVKQIGGCSSDTVPGVEGVGENTAIKYILGKLPEKTKRGEPTKAFQNIQNGKDIIQRNKLLVNLPFKGTPTFKIQQDQLRKRGLKRIAKEYEFRSIKQDFETWKSILRLK